MKKQIIAAFAAAGIAAASSSVQAAQNVTVSISNITNAMYFTPVLIVAHEPGVDLWELGEAASAEVQAIAEGGDKAPALLVVDGTRAARAFAPQEEVDGVLQDAGPIGPGETQELSFRVNNAKTRLTVLAMVLPTNDGFVGGDSITIPRSGRTKTVLLQAYDAGTEVNDESIVDGSGAVGVAGIPADPGGNNNGTNGGSLTDGANPATTIHIHRGITGGAGSNLVSSIHGWRGPVAKLVISAR